ncbi:precorrin-6y C5,15-methyltransferase (decarboxylating) subunit CbiE [Nocardioides daejeonensis]|uniref:precorrin-6y C5,15-methyltransferase (decarboxylating) subunit CbiE n=1 Tax=Nocardioides daejeonensis TaxID=1046556 RepID=UPI000D741AD5|nr:precorrin-6y C5,15-methyltransferase (decarboxylating) subunit CbiE [Nocardioides daejeonensis]
MRSCTGDDPSRPGSGPVTVIGLSADGRLASSELALLAEADVVIGARRHLDLLPPVEGQQRELLPSPLRQNLQPRLEELGDRRVVVLASGDPLVSGIGSTLIELLGADRVVVRPAVSSIALARAQMRWAAESCAVLTLVGRDPALVLRELAPGHRLLLLSSDETTPGVVAGLLATAGYGASTLTVLGDLGTERESLTSFRADSGLPPGPVPRLNIVAVELDGPLHVGWSAGLPDGAFEHDGQLTKRDLRASALSRLLPAPGQLLWDVGAGAGSVGIEWLRAHPTARAVAVERDSQRAARISRNAHALGVPGLGVVTGRAPDALTDLPDPDAIFVGGGATVPGVLEACTAALRGGGRLVVHGVTLETEQALARAYAEHGGELTRIHVEQAAPIGGFTGWAPARAVTQWSWRKS